MKNIRRLKKQRAAALYVIPMLGMPLGVVAAAPARQASVAPATLPAPAPVVIELDATKTYVNVMKNAMPKIPAFPALKPKPGYVRGFVKDTRGRPLQGATLGVRSSAVGGAYSGAQGKTDAKGYYEIRVPFGAAHFYNAGYRVDYGEGRAGLGLHPADGELDSFASNVGGVENFVLLPYGIADRDEVQDKPYYSGNYYGGCVSFDWNVMDENPVWANKADLPPNAQIEIVLTPQAPLINGSKGPKITVRKRLDTTFGQLGLINLPITTYRLSVKLVDGGPLMMKEVGPNGGSAFGIEPKEAEGETMLSLRPGSAQPERAVAGHSNWDSVSIKLFRKE